MPEDPGSFFILLVPVHHRVRTIPLNADDDDGNGMATRSRFPAQRDASRAALGPKPGKTLPRIIACLPFMEVQFWNPE